MSWQPLLDGVLKDRALECVGTILDDLSAPRPALGMDSSLASGAAGLAILFAEKGIRTLFPEWGPDSFFASEPSLYCGLAGVGWAMSHLQDHIPGFDQDEDLAELDDALLHHLETSPWRDDFDLISGLVGIGVYALKRLPRPNAVSCLERLIEHLAETAIQRPEGITWWTNPSWLSLEDQQRFPNGYFNLGLAHGVPGVIALLGQACAARVGVTLARPLLEEAVRWLLSQQKPGGFPDRVLPEVDEGPARLAWCYGDTSVAVALLGAARCVDEPSWEHEALAILRRACHRPPEQSGVVDAGLCHGAAGLGHLFNRTFQATHQPHLADAARFWFERTLQMRRRGHGVGGFESWALGDDGDLSWVAEPGLLTGAAGVAFALLAAVSATEPSWDRVLMVAIPPARSGSQP
jgi:hypothetical protein